MKNIFTILLLNAVFVSCNGKEKLSQQEVDENIITNYITENNIDASATGTGLYVEIDDEGTGAKPTISSTVTVAYKGYLTDGNVFDESSSDGITFSLANVIQGWREGIPFFREGGEGKLLIPSALGYGSQSTGSIPKNAVLIFEVELIKVF